MGRTVHSVRRFPTGLAHYVYDVATAEGEAYVVRLTRERQKDEFAGALYWYSLLKPRDVPLPELFFADATGQRFGFPVLVMERLPGTDLCHTYASLTHQEKQGLAKEVAGIQQRVTSLPAGKGFGYALSYDGVGLHPLWTGVLCESLARSRQRIRVAGVIDANVVDRVEAALPSMASYFDGIEPVCFLHDMQAKNVIVDDGKLSGIVDVDSVCFGDPLYTLALTRMALLSDGCDTLYVDAWADALTHPQEQRSILTLYTAICCVDFLSELGHRFNQNSAAPVKEEEVSYLSSILDRLLTELPSLIHAAQRRHG